MLPTYLELLNDWLPLYAQADITLPEITCVNCGRVLAVVDTTPNMRSSITEGIAKRLYEGDEYEEVHDAVSKYFAYQIQNPPPANRYDRKPRPQPEAGRTDTGLIDKPIIGSLMQSQFGARLRRAFGADADTQCPKSPTDALGALRTRGNDTVGYKKVATHRKRPPLLSSTEGLLFGAIQR